MSLFSAIINTRLIHIKIGNYRFSPGIFITAVTVIVVYILFSLGQWQQARAAYKENLQQKIVDRQNLPVTVLANLPATVNQRIYMPVTMTGLYDNTHQFLLDNRIVNSQVGYDVYTPFIVDNEPTLLVNRGFVRLGETRAILPDVTISNQPTKLSGLINKAPAKGFTFANNQLTHPHWPLVLEYIDFGEISKLLNIQLMNRVLILDKDQIGSLHYHLPVLNLNSDKNTGYAFQWFAMAFTVCLLYLFLNTKKNTNTLSE